MSTARVDPLRTVEAIASTRRRTLAARTRRVGGDPLQGQEPTAMTAQHREVTTPEDNLATARRYLAAVAGGAIGEELAAYYTPDVVQEEFPNRLVPNGARRGLAEMLEGAARGQQLMAAQTYDVDSALATGGQVALEVRWSGTLAIPLGSLPAGSVMRARIAIVLDFRDGKIAAQRNYDCYEPF